MSSQELKKFITLLESIEAETMQSVNEGDQTQIAQVEGLLDDLENALYEVVTICGRLSRAGDWVSGPFSGQIDSYTRPWMQAFLEDRSQPGSVVSLRNIFERSREEEDDEYDDLEEDFAAKSPSDSSSPLSHANQQDLVVKGNHNEDQ
jgi:hypothetical protein